MIRLMSENWIDNGFISANRKTIENYVPVHTHEFYEIEYIVSGEGTYTINGTEYDAVPGTLFFMTPIEFHDVSTNGIDRYCIRFTINTFQQGYMTTLTSENSLTSIKIKESDKEYFEVMFKELVQNSANEKFAISLLNCIIAKISAAYCKTSNKKLSPISMAELYILNNFKNNISLKEVAEYAGFAPSYFSALFKKTTGKTVKEYIDKLRFEYACKLLGFSDMAVNCVCNESGFDDYTNFTRRFKMHFGVSPGRYREENAGKHINKNESQTGFVLVR